jgi:hypothetical protein
MSHRISVIPARGGRKFQYRCTCGARGFECDSEYRAEQMGRDHISKKTHR